MQSLGERLLQIIEDLQINKSEFAKSLEVSPATISLLLANKSNASNMLINNICSKHTLVWIIQSFILVTLCVLGNVIVYLI